MKNVLTLLIGVSFAFGGLTGCCSTAKKNCPATAECPMKTAKCPKSAAECPMKKTSCCTSAATTGKPANTSN